ncbi:MAG: iron-containing alcohol dehydrogenase family protein [Clostridiales bacterium]|nr:iron-containing alcohol dehydrogenase family protein [Clostridiales bacterium]
MKNKSITFPNYSIGNEVFNELSQNDNIKNKNILIVSGKNAWLNAENDVVAGMKKADVKEFTNVWYGGECSFENINKIKNQIIDNDIEVVFGVGGGKALDTAKAAANMTNKPIYTIPTIASTCAASTALSVVYDNEGKFDSVYFIKKSPEHVYISTKIIAESPYKFQWAGIGDTLAKYYEVNIASRNKILNYEATLGKRISYLSMEPLVKYGQKALLSNKNKTNSIEFDEVILSNIINTGFVSLLVGDENNSAAAHGIFYGMTTFDEIEKNHLHGEVVAYGVLVLLLIDGKTEEVKELKKFYKKIDLPTCLSDIGLNINDVLSQQFIQKALNSPDMNKMPFKVTQDILIEGVMQLEALI